MIARIFSCLLAVGCACNWICVAQAPTPAPTAKPRFAIEYPGEKDFPPIYETIPDSCSTQLCHSLKYGANLHRLANPDPTIRQPSVLELMIKVEGDEVTITPAVYYGEIDPKATAIPSVEKLEKQTLESYSGRLNDSVTLSSLERVGLEPMRLKIVSAQSDNPYHPLTRSNAPSLDMEYAPEDRTSGTLTIHNRSSKAVVALQLGASEAEDGRSQVFETMETVGASDLIAPGATYQYANFPSYSWKIVNGSYVEHLPTYLTINAVVFADGSYEGELQTAAEMAAQHNGSAAQRQRILSLIAPILANTQLDDMARAERIHVAVKQLSEDPDAQMIAGFRAQYPNLPDSGYSDAKSGMSGGLKNEKERFDNDIEQFATGFGGSASQKNHPLTLEHWLALSYVKTNAE